MRSMLLRIAVVLVIGGIAAAAPPPAPVTAQDLLAGLKDPPVADVFGRLHRPAAQPLTQLRHRMSPGSCRSGCFRPTSPAFPDAASKPRRSSSTG